MSKTAVDFFTRYLVATTIARLSIRPFPIQEVRFWLRKANEISQGGKIPWQEPHMSADALKELLQRSYRSHLLDVRRMRQLLAETLGGNLHRELNIKDTEILQFIVDEIKLGNITEAELRYEVNSLEQSIYWFYNGHSRNESPSVLAHTG